jgi:hypothetical protein
MKESQINIELVKESCAKTIVMLDLYASATADSDLPTIEVQPLYFTLNLLLIELCEDKPNLGLIRLLIEKDSRESKKLEPVFDDIMAIALKYAKSKGMDNVVKFSSN